MATDWDTYTNTDLEAVNTSTLSADDLQTYREEMLGRGLSTVAPPTVPSTPAPPATTSNLQSPGGTGYGLSVADDGSLIVTNLADPSKVYVMVKLPDAIVDGQILVYSAASNRMIAADLASAPAPADAITADSDNTPLHDESGASWLENDTLPDWLTDETGAVTLTDETGAKALLKG